MKLLFMCLMFSGCTQIERELTEDVIEEIVEYECGTTAPTPVPPKINPNMPKE